MTIIIKTIPHESHRYETVGDWWFDKEAETLHIRVSDMGNEDYEAFVAVHELWEVLLCRKRGISQELVDDFDTKFESQRAEDNFDEPGDDPKAPYHREHCSATGVERLLCSEYGIPWKPYEETIESL